MADNINEHITSTEKASQKADEQHRVPREKEQSERVRVHRSMYLERASYDRLNEAYKLTSHKLYPLETRKSTFMEVCIAYALDHLSDIEAILRGEAQRR
ncbi:MAG TPA: hypothetical protein VKR83_13730 [Ktedonobacteraceae bacterium]|nr:hypothetical protein [Ktedonobacteraceae bacterium]